MSYELTDEKIIDLVTQYHLSGVQNRHILAKAVAKAAQEKYRNYYLNMTDEELREEVAIQLHLMVVSFAKQHGRESPEELWPSLRETAKDHYRELAAQILSLVMANFVKRIEGVENPHPVYSTDGKTWNPYGYDKMNTWNEAIQAVLKVIKEVGK